MSNHRFCCCEACSTTETTCEEGTVNADVSLEGSDCFNDVLASLNSCETGPIVFDVDLTTNTSNGTSTYSGWLCDAPESVLCSDPDLILPADIPPCYACTYVQITLWPTCGNVDSPVDSAGTIPYWFACIQYSIYIGGQCSPVPNCIGGTIPSGGEIFNFYGLFYKSRSSGDCNHTGSYTAVDCSAVNVDTLSACGTFTLSCPEYYFTTGSTLTIS